MTTERNQGRGPEGGINDQGIGDAGFAGMGDAAVNGGGFVGEEAHTADGSQTGANQESWDEEQERLRLTNEANSQYDYLTTRQWGPDNLFDILDLDPEEATEADVVAAHKRLLGLLHPDKGYVTDHAAAQVLNVLYDPWKKKRNDAHNKKVREAEDKGEPKPKKTSSKAKGSGKKFGGYRAPGVRMPQEERGQREDTSEPQEERSTTFDWGSTDDFDWDYQDDIFEGRARREREPEPEQENSGFGGGETPPPTGGGFGDRTRDFWENYTADTANAKNARRLTSFFGPSFANFIGDFVGVGDASNIKATISANAAYRAYNAARNNWDGMTRLARGASAAGLGFLASNAFSGGYHEKGNLFAAAAGATYGAMSESRAGDWVKDNLTRGGSVASGATSRLRDRWETASERSKNVVTAGLGWFSIAESSNILDWPKGAFNNLTAAISAAAVSGLTYGGYKLKDKWDAADDVTKKKYKRNALVGMGAVALGVAGLVTYRYGFGGGSSGNRIIEGMPTTTRPRSGNSSTTLAEQVSSTTQAPNGNTSSTISSTTAPSTTIPSGSRTGSSFADLGDIMPRTNGGITGERSGAGAEEAFKKAAKLQEVLAKQRANKLGLKLSDEQAKKLVEERFGNLFSGKPSNFERFANASDEAKQAFTDYDLKQAAA